MSDSSERDASPDLSRRELLRRGAGVALALPAAAAAGALVACGEAQEAPKPPASSMPATGGTTPPAAKPPTTTGGGAPPAKTAPSAAGGVQYVTDFPAQQSLVSSLQYVDASPFPDKNCANCQLYTQQTAEHGKCQLFQQGVVAAGGHCASWVPKQT